jgi:hypothetical protein
MKRRVCSYDMIAVPDASFVLKDTVGEMYFCNLRCFCIWSVQLATRPNLSEEDKTGAYSLTSASVKNISSLGCGCGAVGDGNCFRIKRFRELYEVSRGYPLFPDDPVLKWRQALPVPIAGFNLRPLGYERPGAHVCC